MLDSRKSKNFDENKVVTICGPGTTVNGEIVSKGTIRIEGTVVGRVQSDDTIVVQESGRLKADLLAGQVIISGEVRANVSAQERVEITSTGKLLGDITAPRVSLAEGALFEGQCATKAPAQTAAPTQAATPATPTRPAGPPGSPATPPGTV